MYVSLKCLLNCRVCLHGADLETHNYVTTYIHTYIHSDDIAEEKEQETVIIDGVPRDAAWLEANAKDFSLWEKEVAANLTEEISKLNVNLWTDVNSSATAKTDTSSVRVISNIKIA